MDDDATLATLERIEKLMQVLVKTQLGPILEQETADKRMKELYTLTGSTSVKDAAKKLKCSATTIVDAWRRWESLGLLVKEGKQYSKVI